MIRGAALAISPCLLLLAGCPDTRRGETSPAATTTSSTTETPTTSGSGAVHLEWRQTVDTAGVASQFQGRAAISPDGEALYQVTWLGEALRLSRDPETGFLSEPRRTITGCNHTGIVLSPTFEVAYVSTYWSWACGRAISTHPLLSDGLLGDAVAEAWNAQASEVPPTGTQNLVLHPSGKWVYITFDNKDKGKNSQIARLSVDPAGLTIGSTTLYTLQTGNDRVPGLALSPNGRALYLSELSASRLTRFSVQVESGVLVETGSVVMGTRATVQAVCHLGERDHVYLGSLGDHPPEALASGALWHQVYLGQQLESSDAIHTDVVPGVARARAAADPGCAHLFVAGNRVQGGEWVPVILVFSIDPDTGELSYSSEVKDIPGMSWLQHIVVSADGKFVYVTTEASSYLHVLEVVSD